MNTAVPAHSLSTIKLNLPTHRGNYYDGKWHEPDGKERPDQLL